MKYLHEMDWRVQFIYKVISNANLNPSNVPQ